MYFAQRFDLVQLLFNLLAPKRKYLWDLIYVN